MMLLICVAFSVAISIYQTFQQIFYITLQGSQRHSVFKDGNLPKPVSFIPCHHTAGRDVYYTLVEVSSQLVGVTSLQQANRRNALHLPMYHAK